MKTVYVVEKADIFGKEFMLSQPISRRTHYFESATVPNRTICMYNNLVISLPLRAIISSLMTHILLLRVSLVSSHTAICIAINDNVDRRYIQPLCRTLCANCNDSGLIESLCPELPLTSTKVYQEMRHL
jgi:hypothetical protein